MLLRKVPGSFLSEMVPKGCPTNYPPSMAAFELAEKLITNGHAYRWLAFGYGRDWHAVGNSPDSALAGLRCRYQWQLAHLRVIQITPRFLASEQAQAYFRWKESSKTEPPIGYAENYMFLKLKRLWDYTPD